MFSNSAKRFDENSRADVITGGLQLHHWYSVSNTIVHRFRITTYKISTFTK